MDEKQWARACDLFDSAAAMLGQDRRSFLDTLSESDPALAAMLARMLDADGDPETPMDRIGAVLSQLRLLLPPLETGS